MNDELISRSALLNQIDTTDWSDVRLLVEDAPTVPQINIFCENADEEAIEAMEAELLKVLDRERQKGEWIPIKTRPMTEEEKQNAIEEHGIDPGDLEYPFAWHFDCELPKLKEGEQSVDVLVTTALGFVEVTNFFIDYLGCPCFEDMDESGEFVAWMPIPKAYEGETT